jgi:preprotein translocase subunit SecA
VSVELAELDPQNSSRETVIETLVEDALAAYDEREEEFGDELMRALERHILLQIIDTRWKEHLHEMDYLREGIHLRGFAQIDPLVAYKNEGFIMFEALMDSIWEEFARLIFHVDVELQPAEVEEAFAPEDGDPGDMRLSGGTEAGQPSALAEARAAAAGGAATATAAPATAGNGSGNGEAPTNAATVVKADAEKIGRNDPCWCGSGKKYKKCHGA